MIKMTAVVLAGVLAVGPSAQAQVIYLVPGGQYPVIGIAPGPYPIPDDPNRVVRLDIEKAIRRALTPPSRPTPPPVQTAVPPPPQATPPPPPQETREQWRQRLFDEMRSYCTQWPTDTACGPNALSGGSGR